MSELGPRAEANADRPNPSEDNSLQEALYHKPIRVGRRPPPFAYSLSDTLSTHLPSYTTLDLIHHGPWPFLGACGPLLKPHVLVCSPRLAPPASCTLSP